LARAALAELAPRALEKNLEIALADGPAAEVDGDPGLIAVLLRNLVDNAVRHGGGEVRVSLRQEAGAVVLEVADDGPGVADVALPQLGRRFYRAPDSRGIGSGLGLSIVTRIAQLHGATIAYANGPGRRGFRVRLAFAPDHGLRTAR
jgi:signal transduction histidine kinase